jgi:molybdopterin synthase sulfur carrier subunit
MNLKIFGTLRQTVDAKSIEVKVEAGDTVRDVLETLSAEYPVLGERILDNEGNLQASVNIILNGRSIKFLDGLDSTVQDGDAFAVFPAVGGG